MMTEQAKWIILVGLVGSVLSVLDLNLVLFPLWAQLGQVREELSTVRAEVEQATQAVRQLPAKRQQLEQSRRESSELLARLPDRAKIPQLLEVLAEYARSANVKLYSVRPVEQPRPVEPLMEASPPEPDSKGQSKGKVERSVVEEYLIQLKAQCGYHELGQFLNRIEREQPALQVSGLMIEAQEASPLSHHVGLRLSLFFPSEGHKATRE